jgi:poly(hydroxyalkanoate) depolymerase family esterase
MRRIPDTMMRLARARQGLGRTPAGVELPGRLRELAAFGPNPGALGAWCYVPANLRPGAALVVVLHGCLQSATEYDAGSGWSRLADAEGFAVLYPEQTQANNPNRCFNWFQPGDSARDAGEPLSIASMVRRMGALHGIDRRRIFVTGLSAGGAMTSVMLATYPEIFAGGAIIAGLPYGVASTVPEAFDRMRAHGLPSAEVLESLLRRGSGEQGEGHGDWPIVSVWHGSGDTVVSPANAAAILAQWRAVHRLPPEPSETGLVDGYPRRAWCDARGRALIEEYSITGMGHGTPLAAADFDAAAGGSGRFMLDARISSTRHIARFWGISSGAPVIDAVPAPEAAEPPVEFQPERRTSGEAWPKEMDALWPARTKPSGGVGRVIEDALRAAGLMR